MEPGVGPDYPGGDPLGERFILEDVLQPFLVHAAAWQEEAWRGSPPSPLTYLLWPECV